MKKAAHKMLVKSGDQQADCVPIARSKVIFYTLRSQFIKFSKRLVKKCFESKKKQQTIFAQNYK